MWRTRWMSIFGAVVLVLAMIWTPVMAQAAEKPAETSSPVFGEWITLQPGEHVVVPFHYAAQTGSGGIDIERECRVKEGHQASKDCVKDYGKMNHSTHLTYDPFRIELFTQDLKAKPVAFNVLRTEDLETYVKTGVHTGIGAGAKDKNLKSQLSWQGYFMNSGTDYVILAADANAAGPITVKLALSGAGVGM